MQITPKQLASFSLSGFIVSLLVHLLTLTHIYLVSNITIGALTIGMLAVWLFSSKLLKESAERQENPWKDVFVSAPSRLRYFFIFIAVYAALNTLLGLRLENGPGYFDTDVSAVKIRVISGFWLLFYNLGFLVGLSGTTNQGEVKK